MTTEPMKLRPVECPETSAPNYFPMLTAWKTRVSVSAFFKVMLAAL
jgi:hypothetical protein